MKTYTVLETCLYTVQAESEKAAELLIINDADRVKYLASIVERDVWEACIKRSDTLSINEVQKKFDLMFSTSQTKNMPQLITKR